MATHSSILDCNIPWSEELGGYSPRDHKESDVTEHTHTETLTHQAPSVLGLSQQEYWSELPFSSPGNLPDPGIEPWSFALAGSFFTTEPPL